MLNKFHSQCRSREKNEIVCDASSSETESSSWPCNCWGRKCLLHGAIAATESHPSDPQSFGYKCILFPALLVQDKTQKVWSCMHHQSFQVAANTWPGRKQMLLVSMRLTKQPYLVPLLLPFLFCFCTLDPVDRHKPFPRGCGTLPREGRAYFHQLWALNFWSWI